MNKIIRHVYRYLFRNLCVFFNCYKCFGCKFDYWNNKRRNKYTDNNFVKLNYANNGEYEILDICFYNEKIKRRIVEIGLIPGKNLIVINKNYLKMGVIIKIKNTKLALNNIVADKILLKRRKYVDDKKIY
ncbi:MAG: ferrous iron transport protein A [Endomicrobium sp.]|jgi:Fe2+ transport system protein FeoA|nr:ferrous iron transport protein A [Endomicrobium sp.]